MTIDVNKSFEVIGGVLVNENSAGNVVEGPFYTGGPNSPVGLNLPEKTFYVQNLVTGIVIWKKFGNGVSDWRPLSAQDIAFDPTGYLNFDPTDTDVELALAKIGNFSIGDIAEAEAFVSFGTDTTTSNGWVSKTDFPQTSELKTAGIFSLRWSAEVGQTKTNRNFGFRTRWRPTGGTWATMGEVELTMNRDGDVMMQSGFQEVLLPANNNIELDIQHGQTIQGSSSILQNVSMELRRIGDVP